MQESKLTIKQMEDRISELKNSFGDSLYMPCHHYQKDEIIQFADDVGDSLELAKLSANNKKAEFILFGGVHFMAETADILTNSNQKVFLPNKDAGCALADMANIEQTEYAWKALNDTFSDSITPLTYINSTAAIKAFVGDNNGSTLTSSNAKDVLEWGLSQSKRVLFLPDQHLGKNTAFSLGISLDQMAIWNPLTNNLEFEGDIDNIRIILWKGYCSTHQDFTTESVKKVRQSDPNRKIIVHPECEFNVVQNADYNGSTKKIVEQINNSPSGSKWAIGTEANLVNRLIEQNADKDIILLSPDNGICNTMNEIRLSNLLKCLENINSGLTVNRVTVDENISHKALIALENMLKIK